MVGALVGLLGVPAGLFGNELSLRLGLRVTAMGVFLVSALANALFGFAAMLPYGVVVGLAMVAAFIVQGNFSNLTSGCARGRRAAVERCDSGGVLVHRLRRWLRWHIAVWHRSRLVRRNHAARGLGAGIRHLRCCMPCRQRRKHIPVARFGAGARGSVTVYALHHQQFPPRSTGARMTGPQMHFVTLSMRPSLRRMNRSSA